MRSLGQVRCQGVIILRDDGLELEKKNKPMKESFWWHTEDVEDDGNDGYGGSIEEGLGIRQWTIAIIKNLEHEAGELSRVLNSGGY